MFARFLFKLADVNNTAVMDLRCHEVLDHSNVHGHILEIGSGTGINFPCLYNNTNIQSYIGIEPNIHMHSYFNDFIRAYPSPFDIRLLNISAIDMSDVKSNSIDTVIMTLVFCSIPDPLPAKVLLEVHRILKPGGKFLFFEHILANPELHPFVNGFQRLIQPIWAIISDGCQFKPTTNYFDAMKTVFSQVNYEKIKIPMPISFANDGVKGQLTK